MPSLRVGQSGMRCMLAMVLVDIAVYVVSIGVLLALLLWLRSALADQPSRG